MKNKTLIYLTAAFVVYIIMLILKQPFVCFSLSTAVTLMLILAYLEQKEAERIKKLRQQGG